MSPKIIRPNTYVTIECDNEPKLVMPNDLNDKIQPKCIPETVTEIIFNYNFNVELEPDVLPEGLTNLTFGYNFN